ncbi:MAG: Protein tolR [Candidatus Magnetoglobus multicellularis str. Araruama]|uniref:Protein tolR n=1 Tax=Candidatus Magnetoglobus multicellularis str. Araruama TaxID=890399 RepID=A0A1V1PD56_9BACT|nr:MAG: Protein tolR [Candidatus Magnetoglobus multicellularis str. Araruama]
MTSGGSNNQYMAEINVTPFVDVMLVLLIIFMVSAPMMTQGVDVSLPETSSKSLPTDNESLTITIKKNGEIYINTYQVTIDALQEKLTIILDGRMEKQVYMRADKNVAYGLVVRVMSEVKNAGVKNWA